MRPARARIDLAALVHNYQLARTLGGGRVLAVVKADAYGHGAVACARALDGLADGFGVAAIEEAIELREAGIRAPILLLEGFFAAAELALIEQHQLWTVIASPWQLDALERHRAARPWTLWLKLDSGMHRLGFNPADYSPAWRRARALPWVERIVAMTHFARADELVYRGDSHTHTHEQLGRFHAVLQAADIPCGVQTSAANSSAVLGGPLMSYSNRECEWVRPGLMLYGASTLNQPNIHSASLRPVMHLESRIIAVRELAAGEPIGYGGAFTTTIPTRVGVVALGYADGYPQDAPAGTPVVVNGQYTRLIGRVSMDMLTVDLTALECAGIGSLVQLWGDGLAVADVARATHTSPYRLLSGLKRVARTHE